MNTAISNETTPLESAREKSRGRPSRHQPRAGKKTHDNQTCRIEFQLYDPQARKVFIAGTFNDWNPTATPMRQQGDGKWTAVLKLKPGRYEYKFVVDGNWQADPMSWQSVRNAFDGFNSVVDVPMGDR